MTDAERYNRFMQAYRNLALFPLLEPQEIENFRVSYGRRLPWARLKQEVLASEANGKGHFLRGIGAVASQPC